MSEENKKAEEQSGAFQWDGIDNAEEAFKEKQEQIKKQLIEDAKLVAPIFLTEAGQKALKRLEEKYLDKPVALLGMGMDGERYAYKREGQNSVIRDIQDLIKIVTKG